MTGLALVVGVALAFLTAAMSITFLGEGEPVAARRVALLGAGGSALFLLAGVSPEPWGPLSSTSLVGLLVMAGLVFLLPWRGGTPGNLGEPKPGVDERDIMFSRALLEPGSDRFEDYYRMRPGHRGPDDVFRGEAGLLSRDSAHFHPLAFPAADASFWTIEMLRPFVEGEVEGGPQRPSGLGGGPADQGGLAGSEVLTPEATTRFLKAWALKLGAHSAGVAELKDYHLYSHVGRGPGYGDPVELDHTFALVLTVEMDKEMVDRAPRGPTAMESADQYVRSGVMAVQLADLIRRLGFRARANIDGNYRVICPLVARDAGLGEIGRMGLLMTPKLGPRCRISVVTTDMPLMADSRRRDPTTIDFCTRCRKCADACPSHAISLEDPGDVDGVRRWKIDSEACFTLWSRLGTDCARCMAVCPYSHPDNWMHNAVRWGIRNNLLFRKAAVWGDDLLYGRRPPPKAMQGWFDLSGGPVAPE